MAVEYNPQWKSDFRLTVVFEEVGSERAEALQKCVLENAVGLNSDKPATSGLPILGRPVKADPNGFEIELKSAPARQIHDKGGPIAERMMDHLRTLFESEGCRIVESDIGPVQDEPYFNTYQIRFELAQK